MELTDFSKTGFYQSWSQSVWDFAVERNSLGFMELLGSELHDFATAPSPHSFLLETPQPQPKTQLSAKTEQLVASKVETLCCDHLLIIPPATPNSSSVSSESSEAVNEEKAKREDEKEQEEQEQKQSNTYKQLKPKKSNQKKREREARVAFMTKSEVDHLEDGYRWRKYGQKAVKNSPFPRSYYRCTTASCNVKKRVERSYGDPTIVVTTYEGQHTHISPLTGAFFGTSGGGVASNLGSTLISPQFQQLVHYHHHQQQQRVLSCFGGVTEYLNTHTSSRCRGSVKDYGLLQDLVPSHIFKED